VPGLQEYCLIPLTLKGKIQSLPGDGPLVVLQSPNLKIDIIDIKDVSLQSALFDQMYLN